MSEPVAWIGETLMGRQYINGSNGLLPVGTPLYTHLVELTDEEIKDVYFNTFNWNFSESASSPFLDFARAILRKAQEK